MMPDGSNQAACDPGHVRCRSARITGVAGMKDSAEPDSCCFRRLLGHRHVKDATGLCDAAPIDAEIVDSEIVANRVRRSPDLCVVALTRDTRRGSSSPPECGQGPRRDGGRCCCDPSPSCGREPASHP